MTVAARVRRGFCWKNIGVSFSNSSASSMEGKLPKDWECAILEILCDLLRAELERWSLTGSVRYPRGSQSSFRNFVRCDRPKILDKQCNVENEVGYVLGACYRYQHTRRRGSRYQDKINQGRGFVLDQPIGRLPCCEKNWR